MIKRLRKFPWFLVSISFIFILMLVLPLCSETYYNSIDMRFLYNRAYRLLECLKSHESPFMFYSDNNGMGYGSALLLGNIILYPFLPFVEFGFVIFTKVFIVVSLIILVNGVISFTHEISYEYKVLSLFILTSYGVLYLITYTANYIVLMAIGISLVYFSSLVKAVRGSINFCFPLFLGYLTISIDLFIGLLSVVITVILILKYRVKSVSYKYFIFSTFLLILLTTRLVPILLYKDADLFVRVLFADFAMTSKVLTSVSSPSTFPFVVSSDFKFLSIFGLVLIVTGFFCRNIITTPVAFSLISILACIISTNGIRRCIQTYINIPDLVFIVLTLYALIYCIMKMMHYLKESKVICYIIIALSLLDFIYCFSSINLSIQAPTLEEAQVGNNALFLTSRNEAYTYNVVDEFGEEYNFTKSGSSIIIKFDEPLEESVTLKLPALYYMGYDCIFLDEHNDFVEKELIDYKLSYTDNQQISLYLQSGFAGIVEVYFNSSIYLTCSLVGLLIAIVPCILSLIKSYRRVYCMEVEKIK